LCKRVAARLGPTILGSTVRKETTLLALNVRAFFDRRP
jgi:hypothetical protein